MSNCLVIVDVQNGFLSVETDFLPGKISNFLKSTTMFDHIVATKFYNYVDSPYIRLLGWNGMMDENSQKVSPLIEQFCEKVFKKNLYSCFTDEFEEYIVINDITKLYLLGIDTDCCVLKSASDAFERNIDVEVLVNYCASTGGVKSHQAAITVLERMIGKNNINSVL